MTQLGLGPGRDTLGDPGELGEPLGKVVAKMMKKCGTIEGFF